MLSFTGAPDVFSVVPRDCMSAYVLIAVFYFFMFKEFIVNCTFDEVVTQFLSSVSVLQPS